MRLGNGAFGAAIHREIATRTGRDLPASSVYVTLDRLEGKRMVCSYTGTPTHERGGRRRKHYLLDTAGQRALVRAWRTFGSMTAGIQPELEALSMQLLPGVRDQSFRRGSGGSWTSHVPRPFRPNRVDLLLSLSLRRASRRSRKAAVTRGYLGMGRQAMDPGRDDGAVEPRPERDGL